MRTRAITTGFVLICLSLQPVVAFADSVSCTADTYAQLGREERLYRSVIFGLNTAAEMPINGVLTDKDGDTWLKTAQNEWRSINNQGLTWTDIQMEDQRDVPARRGILETRKALSSELIPPVLQAMRATQCRMQAVCIAARLTREASDNEPITVQPEGCIEFEITIMESCRTAELTTLDHGACNSQVQTIIERESRMLELVFSYDAAYRTLMQFAGTFEGFLSDFRFPLLQPLWQMVRTLGAFDNLPCFLAECNE